MKSYLAAFAALAAMAVPAGLPSAALAQERIEDGGASEVGARFPTGSGLQTPAQARPEIVRVQDRQGRGDRGGNRGRRGEGGDRGARAGGGNRGPDAGGDRARRFEGPRRDRQERTGGERRGEAGRGTRPPPGATAPVTAPPPGQTLTRGPGRDRDRDGRGWTGERGGRGDGDRTRDRGSPGRDRDGRNGRDWSRGSDGRDRDRGTWNRSQSGGWDRDRNSGGRQWNDSRQGRRDYGGFRDRWNQNDWRRSFYRSRSQDWWRNDRGFRGYTGFRSGFYFAPNYGYYAVPRSYFGQRWSVGSYLPSIFWRYSLNDYRTYGLGYPPPGTQWVAVDTTIYLIDSRDGYIIEVIYDAWRW